MTWYSFAILSAFVWGFTNFLFKVSAHHRCNSAKTTIAFGLTTATLGLIFFFFSDQGVGSIVFLLIFSFIASLTYTANNLLKIEALKHVPTSVVFPISRMNTAFVALTGIIFLSERPTIYQVIGILLSVIVIYLVSNRHEEDVPQKNFALGITLSIIVLFVASVGAVVTKYAAVWLSHFAFIAVNNSYNVGLSLVVKAKLQNKYTRSDTGPAILIGFAIGVTHFLGAWMLLRAFELGPLSIVQAIKGMSFVVAVILGAATYKEKLTPKRILGVALTIIAVLLLR